MMVSKYCTRRLALMYLINGGKCGDRLQYQIGAGIQNLKHPLKRNYKHPLLTKWLVPTAVQSTPKIEIAAVFAQNHLSAQERNEAFNDDSSS